MFSLNCLLNSEWSKRSFGFSIMFAFIFWRHFLELYILSRNSIGQKLHIKGTLRVFFSLLDSFSSVRKNCGKIEWKRQYKRDFHAIDFSYLSITPKVILLGISNFHHILITYFYITEKVSKRVRKFLVKYRTLKVPFFINFISNYIFNSW